jgi:hypothetical protein
MGESYNNLPQWLNEGIASVAELYPNPNYPGYLEQANTSQALIPFSELCDAIPEDADQAIVAYAQSESFVRFLYNRFGTDGLETLIEAYADGAACEEGLQTAFNQTLSQLDHQWQVETFNIVTAPEIEPSQEFLSWGGLFVLILFVPLVILVRQLRPRS